MYSVVLYNYKISHSSTTQKIYFFTHTLIHVCVHAKTKHAHEYTNICINPITTYIYNYVIHIQFLKDDALKIILHSHTHSNITATFSFLVSSDIIPDT